MLIFLLIVYLANLVFGIAGRHMFMTLGGVFGLMSVLGELPDGDPTFLTILLRVISVIFFIASLVIE